MIVPRRAFLIGLGLSTGTLALGLARTAAAWPGWPRPRVPDLGQPPPDQLPDGGFAPSVFLHLAADGTVTIVSHRSEMGQGIKSTLPALIADELGASPARVRIIQADGHEAYGNQDTDGSASVRDATEAMRAVGATARAMLCAAAAKRWGVRARECDTRDHQVVHAASGRALDFGALAADAAAQPVPAQAAPRPYEALRRIGGPLPHVDAPDIVTGRASYGADVRVPGMRIAVIARPPALGGKVARYDASRALAVPGVERVVELPALVGDPRVQPLGGLAVVADTTWAALRGRAALDVTWDDGPNASYDSAAYRAQLVALARAPAAVVRQVGDVDRALAGAAKRVTAEYYVPHLAHATMEPPVALAHATEHGCEVWAPTQDPQGLRRAVARALGLAPAQVVAHVTLLGCGFGRKSFNDFAAEAAVVSRAIGAPVRVQWTRDDDLRHDYYLPASAQRLEAGLDARGQVVAWLHRTAFAPIGLVFDGTTAKADVWELAEGVTETPLAIDAVRAEHAVAPMHTRIGWLRGVHNNQHAFAFNAFVDELAAAARRDPRELLLEILGPARPIDAAALGVAALDDPDARLPIDPARYAGVIARATEMARWSEQRAAGRALGLAAHRTEFSYAAWVVAVSRAPERASGFAIDEAWGAIDCGRALNPDRVRAQLEGAFAFGASVALHGSITMRAGATVQSNFHDYPIARIGEVPRAIHVDVVASEATPGGVGEVGEPPVAPAIANAVAALTGVRLRELPLVLPRSA